MTDAEKITEIQVLVNDTNATSAVLTVYLTLAKQKILSRLYPFYVAEDGDDELAIPSVYDQLHCELTSRMYLRRGGEGEITHNENGVNRTYGSVNDEDILKQIVPYAVVVV